MQRRDFLKTGLVAGAAAMTGAPAREAAVPAAKFGHSVCHWCYQGMTVEELARAARSFGMASVELLDPSDWPTLAKHNLICAMANPPVGTPSPLTKGFNRPEHHAYLVPTYLEHLPKVQQAGYPNLICFSGNREGMDDEEGLEHCVRGLQQILPAAERQGVTICMELLNSRVDHLDYMGDRTAWGFELVRRVGSDRFRILYDIYHMQIMEGDIIRTIRDHHDLIAHYHTGGNPGRHEIDETQELNYRAIMQAIAETGFDGYVAQEFIPARDPLTSLRAAVTLCTV
jgi:hydroxypyruvate isomerase